MSDSVYGIDFTRALPDPLKNDGAMLALGKAIAGALHENIDMAKLATIYPRIDALDEGLLDILAWDLHVDWYEDDITSGVDVKRRLIKNSVKMHKYLGTPYAVKRFLHDYMDGAVLQEWFEYGGLPYRFRIVFGMDTTYTNAYHRKLLRSLNVVKRLSAHMQSVVFEPALLENRHRVWFHLAGFKARLPNEVQVVPELSVKARLDSDARQRAHLTTVGHVRYDGKFRYDGTALYDGRTARYEL